MTRGRHHPSAGDAPRPRGGVARPRRVPLAAAVLPLALLFSPPTTAQEDGDQPIVRARIETETPVMVGETVTLSIDVLTPTWFPRAPELPAALDVENAVAVFDDSFRVNLSERVGNDTWSGIRRHYLVYPQLPGRYTVPSFPVSVVYALPNARPSEPLALAVPELRFEARVPTEAADLGYFIVARGFSLEQAVEPELEGLRVGDAVRRTVTMTATDASSMMLPITEFPPIEGLAVYPDPTRADDHGGERGSAREAMRVDAATYVLETEGTYVLPEVRRSWWDLSAGRLREATIPSVAFDVAPNPDLATEIALPEEPEGAAPAPALDERPPWWRRGGAPLLILLALALLGGLVWRLGPTLGAFLEDARRRRRESEEAHFGRILAACRRDDAGAAMRALLAWADRVTPADQSPTLHLLLARAAEPELSKEVRALERALYGKGDAVAWRGGPLARALVRARRAGRSAEARRAASRLAPLNPTA